jgi:hypothetical protein
MPLNVSLAESLSARPAAQDARALESAESFETVRSGGELLTTFLSSNTLLWGCIAMGLIALVTISRVAARRRKAGKASRIVKAQSDAVHEFLRGVREGRAEAEQGVWHYDFKTGAQQFTGQFGDLVCENLGDPPKANQITEALRETGVDLVALARKHSEETEPYDVRFALGTRHGMKRSMLLRACNMRNGAGEVQRLIAVLYEVPTPEPSD